MIKIKMNKNVDAVLSRATASIFEDARIMLANELFELEIINCTKLFAPVFFVLKKVMLERITNQVIIFCFKRTQNCLDRLSGRHCYECTQWIWMEASDASPACSAWI